ncbi:toll/interleukin-1 receptor domain-containing protein [Algoriphagus sp. D3-2-R+10]|uniref:toll/interleukin-1 receptor domain-containing protein n=1 Tax=Algoriphagus aurantiacus TaxID=3103948 RepID=UPI002B370B6F|nr:toll/interleukin-1 receptor domain-containing protein [Algoriphagus sp. D3-2-R+10]MEB2777621.1 toll/interleukin-1 receptor domain-containing protein [Algoriphagus sp. D3-2-R+10]
MEKNKIFLSHRHSDTQSDCHRIRETLEEEFGEDAVFLDIENLEPGIRFADAIDKALTESKVVLVAIGPDWFGDPDENGITRLFQAKDWVRREVSAALARPDTRVIPLLLKGATRPTADQLPEELQELADLQTFEISITRWKYDLGVLVEALAKLIPRKKKPVGPIPFNPNRAPKPKSWWAKNYLWVLGVFVLLIIIGSWPEGDYYQADVTGGSSTEKIAIEEFEKLKDSNSERNETYDNLPLSNSESNEAFAEDISGYWLLSDNQGNTSTLVFNQYNDDIQFIEYNVFNVAIGEGTGSINQNQLSADYYNSLVQIYGKLKLSTSTNGQSWSGTISFPTLGTSSPVALKRINP